MKKISVLALIGLMGIAGLNTAEARSRRVKCELLTAKSGVVVNKGTDEQMFLATVEGKEGVFLAEKGVKRCKTLGKVEGETNDVLSAGLKLAKKATKVLTWKTVPMYKLTRNATKSDTPALKVPLMAVVDTIILPFTATLTALKGVKHVWMKLKIRKLEKVLQGKRKKIKFKTTPYEAIKYEFLKVLN